MIGRAHTAAYHDVPELCKSVTVEEIKAKGYSLAPSKYIEFIDHDLEIDYVMRWHAYRR